MVNDLKPNAVKFIAKESESREQLEYNLGRIQLEIVGYSEDDFHKNFYPNHSKERLAELSKRFSEMVTKYETRAD
jgi:hypothetical protein